MCFPPVRIAAAGVRHDRFFVGKFDGGSRFGGDERGRIVVHQLAVTVEMVQLDEAPLSGPAIVAVVERNDAFLAQHVTVCNSMGVKGNR